MDIMDITQHLEQAIKNLIPSNVSPIKRERFVEHYRRCMHTRLIPYFEKTLKETEESLRNGESGVSMLNYQNFKERVAAVKANALDCPCVIAELDDPELCEAGHALEYAMKKWLTRG